MNFCIDKLCKIDESVGNGGSNFKCERGVNLTKSEKCKMHGSFYMIRMSTQNPI